MQIQLVMIEFAACRRCLDASLLVFSLGCPMPYSFQLLSLSASYTLDFSYWPRLVTRHHPLDPFAANGTPLSALVITTMYICMTVYDTSTPPSWEFRILV